MENIANQFQLLGNFRQVMDYANGLVNRTFLVETDQKKYLIQKINTFVFKNPQCLMSNISQVTRYLAGLGKDTLHIIPTKDDKDYYCDGTNFYRCYDFLDWGKSYDIVENYHQCLESGKIIGTFQENLHFFDIAKLNITIPHFHNIQRRYQQLIHSIADHETSDRIDEVEAEIAYVFSQYDEVVKIQQKVDSGAIPLRVVHNDTKLNNVMFEKNTDKAKCLVDLDTVMPGIAIFDFGDAIRVGASTSAEDEMDVTKIDLDVTRFTAYAIGYLSKAVQLLNQTEKSLIVDAASTITLECAMRFLTDYINGDVYFLTKYPNHNLVRARAQIQLYQQIVIKKQKLQNIVNHIIHKLEQAK